VTHNQEDLETLIRRYLILGKKSPKGYETVKCAHCNDYQERGGFKFEADCVYYSCFNCSFKAVYDPLKNEHHVPKNMKTILTAFGISEEEFTRCIVSRFFKEKDDATPDNRQKPKGITFPTTEHPLPKGSVLVSSGQSAFCELAEQYLAKRALKVTDYDWYVTDDESYAGRILIPYFFRNKIIYWQGRSLDDEVISPRYKNPSVEKDNIFFNMDELYRYTNEPLFVTEGPIDAISIGKNAVALLGSVLTDFKRNELKKAAQRRKVVFVIDKNSNGMKLGQEVLRDGAGLEWYITCFPDNYEDSNDALQKLGRLWIASHLSTTACKGFGGNLMLKLNCKQ